MKNLDHEPVAGVFVKDLGLYLPRHEDGTEIIACLLGCPRVFLSKS